MVEELPPRQQSALTAAGREKDVEAFGTVYDDDISKVETPRTMRQKVVDFVTWIVSGSAQPCSPWTSHQSSINVLEDKMLTMQHSRRGVDGTQRNLQPSRYGT